MTINQLRYFVSVADTGHLTRSAQNLLMAQPSLTQSIKKLEEELGFPLFIKKGRALLLTKEGCDFLQYARKAVADIQEVSAAAEHIREDHRGLIRFMHTEPIPRYYIPDIIRHFLAREENRNVRIECDIAGTGKILDALLKDEINFGFCSDPERHNDQFLMYPLIRQPIVLVASRDDPLCSLQEVAPGDLTGRPCISYASGSALQSQLDSFFEKWDIRPDIRYRSSAVQIKNHVARGLGWAFVVNSDDLPTKDIQVLNMPELTLERTTFLAMRRDRIQGEAALRFKQFVLETAEPAAP